MQKVSKKDLNHEDIEESDDGDDGQRRGAKPEKKRGYMSSSWTCSSKLCFLKKLPQFFEETV